MDYRFPTINDEGIISDYIKEHYDNNESLRDGLPRLWRSFSFSLLKKSTVCSMPPVI